MVRSVYLTNVITRHNEKKSVVTISNSIIEDKILDEFIKTKIQKNIMEIDELSIIVSSRAILNYFVGPGTREYDYYFSTILDSIHNPLRNPLRCLSLNMKIFITDLYFTDKNLVKLLFKALPVLGSSVLSFELFEKRNHYD